MSKTWVYTEWLEYHGEGNFTWKKSPKYDIEAGSRAGSLRPDGYYEIRIRSIKGSRLVHRLVYEYHHGECPPLIDHIDQNPRNNKIENLRPLDKSGNAHNSSKSVGVVSFRGVSWDRARNKFAAYFKNLGKRTFLGYFNTAEEAYEAYTAKKQEVIGHEQVICLR